MRVAGESIAREAGIENGDLAAGTAELQGAGETGKAAADDDHVIHGDGLRVVDGPGLRAEPDGSVQSRREEALRPLSARGKRGDLPPRARYGRADLLQGQSRIR